MNNALYFDENTARRIDQLELTMQTLTEAIHKLVIPVQTLTETLQQVHVTFQNVQNTVKPKDPIPPAQASGDAHV